MDNEKMPIDIDTFTNINDDTNAQNGGYGIYIRDWMYYHAKQFKILPHDQVIITMELDMTQT